MFIQSENRQPFYVSLNGKIYSSTISGYVIIPKLTDGNYSFAIGFAKNEMPEQPFTYTISKKDVGFSLKNFAEKGWGLFNWQTLAVTMANELKTAAIVNEELKVIQDEPISFNVKTPATTNNKTEAVVETQPAMENVSVQTNTIAMVNKMQETEDIVDTPKPLNQKTNQSGSVSKIAEEKDSNGVALTFIDKEGNKADTIQVIIPSVQGAREVTKTKNEVPAPIEKPLENTGAAAETNVNFLDINMDSSRTEISSGTTSSGIATSNANCKNLATEDDYTKLRRKMSRETTDELMMDEAKKFFRNKCFSTTQLRALSTLFLSDEGRYKFFDMSYEFVSDPGEYNVLESEFIDPYFINRFKALLR